MNDDADASSSHQRRWPFWWPYRNATGASGSCVNRGSPGLQFEPLYDPIGKVLATYGAGGHHGYFLCCKKWGGCKTTSIALHAIDHIIRQMQASWTLQAAIFLSESRALIWATARYLSPTTRASVKAYIKLIEKWSHICDHTSSTVNEWMKRP